MRNLIFIVSLLFLTKILQAQPVATASSADILLALHKLKVLGSVLYIAAHPDDENTRLITYLSKEKLYRTGYLSLTRGDGGQNLIGDEQGIELGLIRTQELLAARQIDGGEQFFTRAYDFGYSKNPEETFAIWGKEKILSDMVWVIRNFKPDAIISRFPTTGEGGHGHHTASAILADEAFIAAADASRFPEQLKYVSVWQAKRVLWNTFNFGGNNTTSNDQFKIDVGGYNPLLGKSYGEIAATSRSSHRSQGFGSAATRGEAIEFFKTISGTAPTNNLLDGVNATWSRVDNTGAIQKLVDEIIVQFDMQHPEKSVKKLIMLYKLVGNIKDQYWKNLKQAEIKNIVLQCSGLFIEATTSEQFAVKSDSVKINFLANNRLGVDAVLKEIVVDEFNIMPGAKLEANKNFSFGKTIYVLPDKKNTQPYWLVEKKEEGLFNVGEQQKIGMPDVEPAYLATFKITIEGEDFVYTKPIKYKFTDPVKGEQYQPLFVIPQAMVLSSPNTLLFKKHEVENKLLQVQVSANKQITQPLELSVAGFGERLKSADSSGFHRFENKVFPVSVSNKGKYQVQSDFLYGFARFLSPSDTAIAYLSLRAINHDHIPAVKYLYPDAVKVLNIDLKTVGKKIGYITGAGDKVPEALEQMGYEVTTIDEKNVASLDFTVFDAIITGVRVYNTNTWMNRYYDKLMSYVEGGGNMIVQYNTSSRIGPVVAKIGPYNFDITRDRITNEAATVNFLNPSHPVLNYPNKISQTDFLGWVQERSIYHAANWDAAQFEPIFSMSDPNEKPNNGSLIIAKYGKGYFTYTGLVFFRELPAGVAGAYRLLANLIAQNHKTGK